MNLTDEELIQELSQRFANSRKAFSDLSVVNRKLIEMNQRLEQSESLKTNFLSNIRNEINNPLNAIIGIADYLAGGGLDGTDAAVLASQICSEATNLDFQLRNIFMAAELEAGEVDPHPVNANVSELLSDTVDSFKHSAAVKSITISLEVPVDAQIVFPTDPGKLQIILSNLLANAVEFSREGGGVEVLAGVGDDGQLKLTVRDHGIGISPENQKRIFDRFVQLETGTTRAHRGHGLGLSITKALIDLLQGSITVTSAEGEGSEFVVNLPASSVADDEGLFAEGGNLFMFDDMSEK